MVRATIAAQSASERHYVDSVCCAVLGRHALASNPRSATLILATIKQHIDDPFVVEEGLACFRLLLCNGNCRMDSASLDTLTATVLPCIFRQNREVLTDHCAYCKPRVDGTAQRCVTNPHGCTRRGVPGIELHELADGRR